jgi:hypothetical protein
LAQEELTLAVKHWDGGECALHSLVMQNCEADKTKTSDEIKSLFGLAGQMVTWRVFTFVTLLAVAIVGAGFGYFGTELKTQGNKHADSMDRISNTLTGMAITQAQMMVKVERLESNGNGK